MIDFRAIDDSTFRGVNYILACKLVPRGLKFIPIPSRVELKLTSFELWLQGFDTWRKEEGRRIENIFLLFFFERIDVFLIAQNSGNNFRSFPSFICNNNLIDYY